MSLITPARSAKEPRFLLVHGHEAPHHDVRLALGRRYGFRECRLQDLARQDLAEGLPIILDLPLERPEHIESMRGALRLLPVPAPAICAVIDGVDRTLMLRAHALGAEAVLCRPLGLSATQRTLDRLLERSRRDRMKADSTPAGFGLNAGADVLEDLFAFAAGGMRMTQYELYDRGDTVIESLAETGLGSWIEAVKCHHNQTFRHSLLVTGVAVGFGQQLSMRQADLRRLALAGLVHDIGKALIPNHILEKPGKLNDEEQALMRQHVVFGRDILTRQGGFAPEMIEAVGNHHELLDGSGYPNGLMGDQIKDLVRILTISDIFAALIEERSYKPTMDNTTALAVLDSMQGKVDPVLMQAFRPIALETRLAA